jgi:hypothetical protein
MGGPTEGANLSAVVIADKACILYGTTYCGGSGECTSGLRCGVAFKLEP